MPDPGHILVVEDDPDMAALTVMLLENEGYVARSVRDGREALNAVSQERPALILLDMLMPVMDGWHFAEELRRRGGSTIPVVVITAAENAAEHAREVQAQGALSKPFEVDELLNLVARFLDGKRP